MKFAILSDIHLGPEEYYKGVLRKINKKVKIFLDKFIEEINNNIKPEFLVVLGDLIQDENLINDRNNLNHIIGSLKRLNCSIYYVAGNHDLKNISEDELATLFNQKNLYYSFDLENYHFIILFSKRFDDKIRFYISDEQKDWLQQELDKTENKCVVFVHYGLADQDLTGNPWFEGKPEKCLIMNRKEIRNILSKSNKVVAVFNSHLHWDKKNIHDKIPYFTIQSFVENEMDKGIVSKAYAVVNIQNDKIDVEIKGNYPKKFVHQS